MRILRLKETCLVSGLAFIVQTGGHLAESELTKLQQVEIKVDKQPLKSVD